MSKTHESLMTKLYNYIFRLSCIFGAFCTNSFSCFPFCVTQILQFFCASTVSDEFVRLIPAKPHCGYSYLLHWINTKYIHKHTCSWSLIVFIVSRYSKWENLDVLSPRKNGFRLEMYICERRHRKLSRQPVLLIIVTHGM